MTDQAASESTVDDSTPSHPIGGPAACAHADPPVAGWTTEEISDVICRHEQKLLAYACRMLGGDWQAAQDAVQETFLRLCREDRSKVAPRLAPWLFAVCRSRVIDMQRTQHSHPVDAAEITVADPHPDASSAAIAAEQSDHQRHRLAELVERLSPRQQEVLRLRIQAGLSYREIAQITGLTVSNVGFHLHAAVRSLKDSVAAT
ncbi:sigma-70 family RNA polymerase sigma factor [Roseiconus nitratireducens]|uniref:Sigma-70 family RNA polymerase sigma factor n=1 Tax=Roseiconus nitratireducens TaxID=2605748 RepID=A0A5M6DL85_9BACT|nr:sigma-70 family RNA polymerase sigma factor [Roseiconus nitratireducens]KAA5546979.1 sigma-70 family RNA polymerase sigma factor [Roseiconus nitratireducens]